MITFWVSIIIPPHPIFRVPKAMILKRVHVKPCKIHALRCKASRACTYALMAAMFAASHHKDWEPESCESPEDLFWGGGLVCVQYLEV